MSISSDLQNLLCQVSNNYLPAVQYYYIHHRRHLFSKGKVGLHDTAYPRLSKYGDPAGYTYYNQTIHPHIPFINRLYIKMTPVGYHIGKVMVK